MSDECVRCGFVGEDRRTLWMACGYDMDELNIKFTKRVLLSLVEEKPAIVIAQEPKTLEFPGGKKLEFGATIKTDSELKPMRFYTLLVCKSCRGSWNEMIETWFLRLGEQKVESCSDGS